MTIPTVDIPVIDYEGSHYRNDFWEDQGRDYENAVDRAALRQLMPSQGCRIAEIGAGYGRLADMYLGYDQIVLFDYSRTLLQDAVRQWGHDSRFIFVAGNLYRLPLATRVFDTLVMVRVMHHLIDVPAALSQIQRVLHHSSTVVLEYANKRNLKAIGRWLVKRQEWSPFHPLPHEFVELNFDFHPAWMDEKFTQSGLKKEQQFAVSHFRLQWLKRNFPTQLLVNIDERLFRLSGRYPVTPSVFVQAKPTTAQCSLPNHERLSIVQLFRCPRCEFEMLDLVAPDKIECTHCHTRYAQKQRVWDFKEVDVK